MTVYADHQADWGIWETHTQRMKPLSGKLVERRQIVTLADGTFVILIDAQNGYELLTGQARRVDAPQDRPRPIGDYELAQLRASGRVEHFTAGEVWLHPLPPAGQFGRRRLDGAAAPLCHNYKLITEYPIEDLAEVQGFLEMQGLHQWTVAGWNQAVIFLDQHRQPFATLESACEARDYLCLHFPQHFSQLTVAFVETHDNESHERRAAGQSLGGYEPDEATMMNEKVVALLIQQEDERDAFAQLLETMQLKGLAARSSNHTLELLEDYPVDLLIMDAQLAEMHAWQLVAKLREIEHLRNLPIILLTDQADFGAAVAGVSYLARPISIARLRQAVAVALRLPAGG